MRKNRAFILAAILASLTAGVKETRAQSDTPKYEASAVFTAIRQNDDFYQIVQGFEPRIRHNYGVGGRFTFNLNRAIALEAELTYHPKERGASVSGLFPGQVFDAALIGGKRTEGLFGVKAGKRGRRFGIFAKARPGFMRFDNVPDCPNGDVARCTVGGKAEFALDVGGAFEYYPARRFVIRFDAGDTIIRYRHLTRANFGGLPPTPQFPLEVGGGTTNNAQYSVGFGIRF
jgi:hypothetical protein